MSSLLNNDRFQLNCIIKNVAINLCASIESGAKRLLALITGDGNLLLYYTYGELPGILKLIPWFSKSTKALETICFDPSASWLLVVSYDSSLYIVPALALVDKKQKVDCKWSLNDVTHFSKHTETPDSKPTCVVWWQTLDCNQNAIVGYESGQIAVISLTDGRCLGSCSIEEIVTRLHLCQDSSLDSVFLLINGESGQQWRLILEQASVGYLWPAELNNQNDESTRSKLYNLKQLGVHKLTVLKQKFVEGRGPRRDSDSASESSSHSDTTTHSGLELLPSLNQTYFSPQHIKGRYLFSALYTSTSLLTVHAFDIESAPLYVHKLISNTDSVLLTDKLIYTINHEHNTLSVISSQLSECRIEGHGEFNDNALLAQFGFRDEKILHFYKSSNVPPRKNKNSEEKDNLPDFPKKLKDSSMFKSRLHTCVIVTNGGVYKIASSSSIEKFVQLVTEENNLQDAEKLAMVFGLNVQQLLEYCGDVMISRNSFHSGIILYKQAKVHLLKRVLKLATIADCKTLLKFVHLCLNASRVDMSMATKIHIGNLAVMAYTELLLRHGGQVRTVNTKEFMNFLCYEEFYDQILAINVCCQAGHWNILSALVKSKGLQPEVVSAFGQILQSARAPRPYDYNFLITLSEPSLTQSLIIDPKSSQNIFHYIRYNVTAFPVDILQRFAVQLDPSQPCILPIINRVVCDTKHSSSQETGVESIEMENFSRDLVIVKELVETFLIVLINLVARTEAGSAGFNVELMENIKIIEEVTEKPIIKKIPKQHVLSCGYEHTAIIRNSCVYTMGMSISGCLGLGPLLKQSSPPKLVETLALLKANVLSVSCGRKHTLALTDFGVYSWGSNAYGQLGLGTFVQESSHPQLLTMLSFQTIIQVAAGQYHSLALTSSGHVYTWGWGVHGQLGHRTCENLFYPKPLQFERQIVQVAAGHAHSLVLTDDGEIYGFGSNVFGQLEGCQMEASKLTRPVHLVLVSNASSPVRKIATAYFHNVAVREDQSVYTWGASPHEVKVLQTKNSHKQNELPAKNTSFWKNNVQVYPNMDRCPIEEASTGYRHTALLCNGEILWGKNKNDELCLNDLREKSSSALFNNKFLHVSSGYDYTMAIDHSGKLLAWGNSLMAQTILGKPQEEYKKELPDGKIMVFKNTKRVVKFPANFQESAETIPVEIPAIPSMVISFEPRGPELLCSKKLNPYSVLKIETGEVFDVNWLKFSSRNASRFRFGQKTLHYVLESYYDFYDSENVLVRCLDANNYQAAAKISLLDGRFGDSLGFQLIAFKKYIDSVHLDKVTKENCSYEEKEQDIVELASISTEKRCNEKNLNKSPSHTSWHWGENNAENEQGGCESPCEGVYVDDHDFAQSKHSITTHLKDSETSKIESKDEINANESDEIVDTASKLVEFYIKKIYLSENHILMQNTLLKCIDFWLRNDLPVCVLENILLRNLDKYFYPLSILLFCKNFTGFEDVIENNDSKKQANSTWFLKEFSSKFCLKLCSMALENVSKT